MAKIIKPLNDKSSQPSQGNESLLESNALKTVNDKFCHNHIFNPVN